MGARLSGIEGVLAPRRLLEGEGMVALLFDDNGGDQLVNYIPSFRAKLSACPKEAIQEFLRLSSNRMYF